MTTEEATICIEELKEILTMFVILPTPNDTVEYEAKAYQSKNEYYISITTGKRNPDKRSFCGRLKGFDSPLLRLDVNPSNRHMNNDGTVMEDTHWHVYHEEETRRAFSCPEITKYTDIQQVEAFFKRFSVSPIPPIQSVF